MDQIKILKTERNHLFDPHVNVVIKVDISGNPTGEQLKEAIARAVSVNEILNCKIVLHEDGIASYEKIDRPYYTVQVRHECWTKIVNQEECIPFNYVAGELVRFFILPHNEGIELLIIAHHLAGDGLSITYLVQDIMCALSGEHLGFKPLKILSDKDLPTKSGLSACVRFLLKDTKRKWIKSRTLFTYSDYQKMFYHYWEKRESHIFWEMLSTEEYRLMSAYGKRHNVSLNSLITTLFAATYVKKCDIGYAISVREQGHYGMGNYASGGAFKYRYNKKKTLAENTKKVHQHIHKKLRNLKDKYFVLHFLEAIDGALLDYLCMYLYCDFKNPISKNLARLCGYNKQKNLSLTNLKNPISQNYGEYSIQGLTFVPPIISGAKRVIGIATVGDHLCLTMHVMKDDTLKDEEKVFKEAVRLLKHKVFL